MIEETEVKRLTRERDSWKGEAERLARLIGTLDFTEIAKQAALSWKGEAERLARLQNGAGDARPNA